MRSNSYLISIGLKDNKIELLDLYDPIESIQYNGASKIKDRFFKIKKDVFFKYQKGWNHLIIPVNKKTFETLNNSYYSDIKDISINKFVIKYGLEEYAI